MFTHSLKNNCLYLSLGIFLLYGCSSRGTEPIDDPNLPVLTLDISSTDMLKVRHKRENALRQGLLMTKSDDYVQASLTYKGNNLGGEVRLKGDWLDHLQGDKWSWRVKLADTCQLEGMQRFSLQHPRVRSYLDEWVFHKLLEQEGILTTRYTFVQLVLNGRYKGIYALEEHFDKAMLHANRRPEAPILKFAEDGFWQAQAIHKRTGQKLTHFMPVFESAEIEAFQKNRTLENPSAKECYQAAKNKLQSMRMVDQKASDLVDVNRMARWYALSDLVESYHSMRWHNTRFYYHPIKGVLEPVVYDAFGSDGAYRWFSKPLLGSYGEHADTVWLAEEMLLFSMFNDTIFRKIYHQHLERYAQPGFVENFMDNIKPELSGLDTSLQQEFKTSQYNWHALSDGAKRLRKELASYEVYPPLYERVISPHLFDSCRSDLPIPEVALHVNPVSSTEVQLVNWFCQPITVQATGIKKSDQHTITPIELPRFSTTTWPPSTYKLPIKPGEKYFYYTVPGNDSWFRQKLSPWPLACQDSLVSLNELQIDRSFMKEKGQQVLIQKGVHRLSQLVVIPADYELICEKGTQIDIVDQAALIIGGSVALMGDKKQRIKLFSSDNSSHGIHFLGKKVSISHVDFDGLGDWWGPERWFKGGVTILESELAMTDCTFSNMRGEDALNIVGSNQTDLRGLYFHNCEGDALDLDYCKASINGLSFDEIGGDGLDCSGSRIKGQQLDFNKITDKGISIGEESIVDIQSVSITDAHLGIAVKDASQATLSSFLVNNCQYGVAVFNKKPIFTIASAKIETFQFKNVEIPYVLEVNHTLSTEGEEQVPTHGKHELFQIFYSEIR